MHICFNGNVLPATDKVLTAANKSYRYGDGLFETMKMVNRNIPLFELHMDRLFASLQVLEFSTPETLTDEKLKDDIIALCNKNQVTGLARIRLSISRGEGAVYDQENDRASYLIEVWPAEASGSQLNEEGLLIGIYPHARKSMDRLSSLKSANYLPYIMAARFARAKQWNDCLILNTDGNIADATIANVFLVKDARILTPAEGQGGVSGVMRKWLLEQLRRSGREVLEKEISIADVLDADELFLTNAVNGIRWVERFENKSYDKVVTLSVYNEFIQPLWS